MAAKIIIDCERMKYSNTGLYYYCFKLGKYLLENIESEREELQFYLPQNLDDIFGAKEKYIHQKTWHKFVLPSTKKINVWHATHQDTGYYPSHKIVPVVLTIHDLNVLHNPKKSAEKKKKFLQEVQNKIERADHLTFVSTFTKQDVEQYIDLKNKPVTVIYNGCNIEEIQNLSLPVNNPSATFFFTIGTITDKKNFHVLPVLLVGNDKVLIIAGITQSEDYKQTIIKEAQKNGVEKRVVFAGAITENDKQWYLKNCEAFLFPSLTEGFGLPVVEAMYFGKPIFLSTYTALPEIGGEAAYYFTSFDKEAMQLTLKQGLEHYNQSNASETIKARAATFSWQKSAQKYLEVYRSLY